MICSFACEQHTYQTQIQGIEAQTVATYEMATLSDLEVIPVLTKIDLPHADADDKALELATMFDFDPTQILQTSSKTGEGIGTIFDAIIDRIPAPTGSKTSTLKALLYDSFWDPHRGVIALVYIKEGCLRTNDTICMFAYCLIYHITFYFCLFCLEKKKSVLSYFGTHFA